MKRKILVVEDEFVVANDLRLILQNAAYEVCGIADSYNEAMSYDRTTSSNAGTT